MWTRFATVRPFSLFGDGNSLVKDWDEGPYDCESLKRTNCKVDSPDSTGRERHQKYSGRCPALEFTQDGISLPICDISVNAKETQPFLH